MRSVVKALAGVVALAVAACGSPDGGHADGTGGDGTSLEAGGMMDGTGGGMDGAGGGDGSMMMGGDGSGGGTDALGAPEGSTVLPDGAVVLPDGALWMPDGSGAGGDGGSGGMDVVGPPDGSTVLPDGAVVLPDGAIWTPPDGSVGPMSCPALPDGGVACGAHEVCGNGLDDDCNGLVDEHCTCVPGSTPERCYDGCPSQAGVGVCSFGTMACVGSGEFAQYDGHCTGAGHPQDVVCGGMRDYRCDGVLDEGCACRAGETRPCYDGPSGTRGVGLCQDGVQHCQADGDGGTHWGTCDGEVLPSAPACDGTDHACDGMPYEGCSCVPGTTRSCYDGPSGTAGVGLCHAGMQSCIASGGMASWGTCVGEVLPAADRCDGIDRACNGMPDLGCACPAGARRSCYDGPSGTEGVGLCHAGSQTCVTNTDGTTSWGTCTGEALPSPDTCDGLDHQCNGMPDTGCACRPGATRSCYDGPAGTSGVGLCHPGTQTCLSGTGGIGSSWGPCAGEVTPTADRCDGVDRMCDAMPNSGCTCAPGSTRSCYDGPAGTAGVGVCHAGTQTCNATGTGWGACTGETLPGPEVCDGVDHLCNGMPNSGCACSPGATQSCYDGPAGTAGVGLCHAGTQTCNAGPGGVGSSWGPCGGEVLPGTDSCDGIDRACNGMPYAGCACVPGSTRSCYDGPAGTAGVGLCHVGMQACMDMGAGPAWGSCTGEVLPSADTCDGVDRACDGMPTAGCACTIGTTQSCYDGPPGTSGVGACHAGTQTCVAGSGGVGSMWGSCSGEVTPGAIVCDGIDHACDGSYAADCPCTAGATRSCYDGPAGTAGVGTCHAGTQTCAASGSGGTAWGACSGEVTPAAPQCDGQDHACAGTLPNCAPAVMCPAPVTAALGVGVSLTASATAIPPATIMTYTWSVTSAPAGATYSFSSTTSATTMFTGNNAGVYTVQFTATDSMGRTASCTVLVTVTSASYLGTEFWAVTTANSQLATGFDFAIAIGNPNTSAVNVTVSGGALTTPATFSVPANSTVTHILPWVNSTAQISNGATTSHSILATNAAYRIATSAPVSAYEFNPLEFQAGGQFSYTNDASLLLPTVALTGNYIVLTHNAWANLGDYVAITGTYPGTTTVTVTLSSAITSGAGVAAAAAGTTQTYTLNRGDVVELVSTSGSSSSLQFQTQDLTGSVISANHPVSVISGNDCTFMSWPSGTQYACDHTEQQLFPLETWGRDVVVSQLRDRTTTEHYMVRLLSGANSNTLTFIPSTVHAAVTLNRGQFLEFDTNADFEVQSTQPILVGQFMEGQDTTAGATVGDPAFVLEVPTPQYRQNYNFVVPATYTSSFINVTGPSTAAILLDGASIGGPTSTIAGTSWGVWRRSVAAGSHTITTTGSAGFGIKVLGVASYTSYAYPGGLDLRTLP